MRKIVVVDTAASYGGAMTVLRDFYQSVKKSDKDIEWHFLLSGPYLEEADNIRIHVIDNVKSYPNRIYFDLIRGRQIIKKIDPDLVFSMQNTLVRGLDIPQIIYVHQPVPFQDTYDFSFLKKEEFKTAVIQNFLGAIIKNSIKSADRIIVQTNWTKDAVIKRCHIDGDKVYQVYPTIKEPESKARYTSTSDFIYPTSDIIYKNVALLEKACQMLDEDGIKYSCQITVKDSGKAKGINYSGQIPLEEVFAKYETSCLVFPSYIETFGYPLLEARSVGSIILASDCNFSHELLDGYENVRFFDPFDANALYELMKEVATGKITRKESVKRSAISGDSWNEVISILAENIK